MDIYVLDSNFQRLSPVVDVYESFIWTERYDKAGEFELVVPAMDVWLNLLKKDRYLEINESDYTMIIETIELDTDIEDGANLTITGRSLESLLDRRIIWGQVDCNGDFQNQVQKLLNLNAISPSDSNRKIPNLVFEASTDPAITSLTIDTQFTGDNLYDTICDLCQKNHIGWYIKKNDAGNMIFKLYSGVRRTHDQTAVPEVIFSPSFSNLINTKYVKSDTKLKNVTLVGGEGEGNERKYISVGSGSGLSRREVFTDARSVSSKVTDDNGKSKDLTAEEYNAKLTDKGNETLGKNVATTTFDGEVQSQIQWKFRKDYFVGDVVQIENEFGIKGTTRIIECAISDDNQNGYQLVPTFESDEDENKNNEVEES